MPRSSMRSLVWQHGPEQHPLHALPDLCSANRRHRRLLHRHDAFPGLIHQLCCAHLLRDLEGAAQAYPGAHWPVQIREALQDLIHAANRARAQGLTAIPEETAAPLLHAFRHGVILGLGQVPKTGRRKQRPLPGTAGMPTRPAGRCAPLRS